MAQQQVKIGAVCGQPLSVVVQGIDLTIRLWDPTDSFSVPIIAIGVLVDVVTEKDNIVNRILTRDVAIGVEEAEGEVAA